MKTLTSYVLAALMLAGCATSPEEDARKDREFMERMVQARQGMEAMRPIPFSEFSQLMQAEYERCNSIHRKNKSRTVLAYVTCIENATEEKLNSLNVIQEASVAAYYSRIYRAFRESAAAFSENKITYPVHKYNVSAANTLIINSLGGGNRAFQPVQGSFPSKGFYGEFRGWGSGNGDLTITDDTGRTCIGGWKFSYGNGKGNLLCSDGSEGNFTYTAAAPRGTQSIGSGALNTGEQFTFELGTLSHTEQYATELARQMVLERNTVSVKHSGKINVNTTCRRTGSTVRCR